MWPHRRQPTRLPRPWDSPGKDTGVSCYFLLQCMKVKSESEVAQSNSSRSHGLQPTRLLRPWDFPGKSTGVGCHHLPCTSNWQRLNHDPKSPWILWAHALSLSIFQGRLHKAGFRNLPTEDEIYTVGYKEGTFEATTNDSFPHYMPWYFPDVKIQRVFY